MKTLSIIGAGGHGGVVADAAARMGRWSRIELYDDRPIAAGEVHGFPVSGTTSDLIGKAFAPGCDADVFVAIGDNERRLQLVRQALAAGASLATIVHPGAVVGSKTALGAGTVLMAGAVVNIATRIGVGCIVNTRAGIDHDCEIGDGAHICPGVALAGNVRVGELSWIGVGACVIQGRTIGARVTIGAGSVVIQDVADGVTAVGNPARELRHE